MRVHARTAAINAAADAASAVGESDIVFTATCAKAPVVKSAWVKPGTHVSCIGADLPGKQEVESAVLARAAVYGDDTAQCFAVGECELPHNEGVLPALAGELGEVILGEKAGRTSDAEITVFDSTGIALQDIASAASHSQGMRKAGTRHGLRNMIPDKPSPRTRSSGARVFCNCNYSTRPSIPET